MPMIYLDHNATTALDSRVLEAMQPYLGQFYGNPSSLYRLGRINRSAIDLARQQVADLVGADASQIVFTSGGTEANNLAIKGLAPGRPPGTLAIGATEHPSITAPATYLQRQGWTLIRLPVDEFGELSTAISAQLKHSRPKLLSVMLANNETGVIHDIGPLVEYARESGALLHCDAVQAVGKLPLDFGSCGAQLLSISAHKIYGPKGAGALVVDRSVDLAPLLEGGGQEQGMRSGTENVAALVGFGKAAELASAELERRRTESLELRLRLEAGLTTIPGVKLFAAPAPRLPNTVQFGLNGMEGEALVMLLDRKGFCVASGSACASNAGEPSPVLLAMGVEAETAKTAIRVSLGKDNTATEVDAFLEVIRTVTAQLH